MKQLKYIALLCATASLVACSDFMDNKPKGKVIPETMEDFGGMTLDPVLATSAYTLPEVSCDNVLMAEENISTSMTSANTKAYFWQKEFYREDEDDSSWNTLYSNIYKVNVVIENILGSKGGTVDGKNQIMSEAKINRAYYYWMLVNLYAKAYDANTANSDLGVPLALAPVLEAKYSRATVQEVYNLILSDLNGIAEYLPTERINNYSPIKESAHALAARIYFYMGEYDKAAAEAAKALALNSKLDDMRTWSFKNPARPSQGVTNMPANHYNSLGCLFFRDPQLKDILAGQCVIAPDLDASFDKNDLRRIFFYSTVDRAGRPYEDGTTRHLQKVDYSLTVSEMMLIKAEALARAGNMDALGVLNDLRKYRFPEDKFVPLTAANKDELIKAVLEERRRELQMNGLRWFDMKRLGNEGLYTTTVKRSALGKEYVLEPKSNLNVFPIPAKVISYNSNIAPNPR